MKKHYRSYAKKHTKRQIKIRKYLGGLLLLSIAFTAYFGYLMDFPTYANAEVNVSVPQSDGRTIKEQSVDYLKSRGFSEEQLFDFACLMYYENRGYDPYAYYVNNNKTIDRGLIMWNSKTAPVKISNECSFDYKCSLEKFADYILGGGDWNRWLAFRDKCK